jgi:hypothetical protein
MGRLQYADPLVGDGVESEIAKPRVEVDLEDALFRDDAARLLPRGARMTLDEAGAELLQRGHLLCGWWWGEGDFADS